MRASRDMVVLLVGAQVEDSFGRGNDNTGAPAHCAGGRQSGSGMANTVPLPLTAGSSGLGPDAPPYTVMP